VHGCASCHLNTAAALLHLRQLSLLLQFCVVWRSPVHICTNRLVKIDQSGGTVRHCRTPQQQRLWHWPQRRCWVRRQIVHFRRWVRRRIVYIDHSSDTARGAPLQLGERHCRLALALCRQRALQRCHFALVLSSY
jgi:hypothetical protein